MTGQAIGTPFAHPGEVTDAAFSADGKTIVSGCSDGNVRIWDVASRQASQVVIKLPHLSRPWRFTPTATRSSRATPSNGRLWDSQTGQPIAKPFTHKKRSHK